MPRFVNTFDVYIGLALILIAGVWGIMFITVGKIWLFTNSTEAPIALSNTSQNDTDFPELVKTRISRSIEGFQNYHENFTKEDSYPQIHNETAACYDGDSWTTGFDVIKLIIIFTIILLIFFFTKKDTQEKHLSESTDSEETDEEDLKNVIIETN